MVADTAPVARADVDALPPGSFGPATGNAISGAGTITGTAGADSVGDAPARIVEVEGAGGAAAAAGNNFQASGQYGVLNMDAQGNFNYVRNSGTPDGVQDVFRYTCRRGRDDVLDHAHHRTSARILGCRRCDPGVVNLRPGRDVRQASAGATHHHHARRHADGDPAVRCSFRSWSSRRPGSASNLAALLIESEPQPAAGQLQSSGGNFASTFRARSGRSMGDMSPPTELSFPSRCSRKCSTRSTTSRRS